MTEHEHYEPDRTSFERPRTAHDWHRHSALAAYAEHLDAEPDDAELVFQFDERYLDTYDHIETFVSKQLYDLGWVNAVDEAFEQAGIPAGALDWNFDAVLEHLEETYEIVQTHARVYVFRRDSTDTELT